MGMFADENAKFLFKELARRFGKRAKTETKKTYRFFKRPLTTQDMEQLKRAFGAEGASSLPPRNDLRKWQEVLKETPTFQYGKRQLPKDVEGGEPFDRARWNFRGTPDDAANRGGRMDLNNPIQEAYDTMNYREHLGPVFGMINRTVEKHFKWGMRDKRNKAKHDKWANVLRNYNSEVKQMIVDEEAREKRGN